MAPTLIPTTGAIVTANESFPVVAIVAICIGGYLLIFCIVILVRQCLLAKGVSIFPPWMTECCACSCSCGSNEGGILQSCAETCNFNCPNRKVVLESVCPSKEWCDQTFCCCMSAQPGGKCCEDCQGPECGFGQLCDCQCQCETPETINCICFKIDCAGSSR
ncbi:keratin-associated protein 5-9-like [Rhopilema esculentum]|uniref:keratin-associated protein 5-9-like n=1 Tax=Rhopilema esculentum TaxID=499914 RepID=UPI0031DB60F4